MDLCVSVLIQCCVEHPEVSDILQDIREFNKKDIDKITKTQLDQIESFGFHYNTKTVAGRREEIKAFVSENPCLMTKDCTQLVERFKILSNTLRKLEETPAISNEELLAIE